MSWEKIDKWVDDFVKSESQRSHDVDVFIFGACVGGIIGYVLRMFGV